MENSLNQTTPQKITKEILAFCKDIDPKSNPIFVDVHPAREVRFNYCLTDVPEYAWQHGGEAIFGWIIWEVPGLLLEAEFHTCYKDEDGKLINITPKPDGERQILFLPDSHRVSNVGNLPISNRAEYPALHVAGLSKCLKCFDRI